MPDVYDTIIVGMGASGSTAASTLAKAGKRVLALEAMDRVGGRVNTVPFGDGVVELGAEWIHGQFPSRVYELGIQNNVSILPQDLNFDVYRSDGSAGDKALLNELLTFTLGVVDDPPEIPEPLGQYITRRLTDYIKTKHPQLLNDKDFMDNLLQFLDLIIDNYESSDSWNDVSTKSAYEELGGHQHMSWHRNGYKTLFQILLNTYNNGPGYPTLDIKLGKEVTNILWPQNPALDVVVTCKDGTTYKARNVIVTVSLGVLKERHTTLFTPVLPPAKISAIDNLSFGVIGKVILQFPVNWWGTDKFNAPYFIWYPEDKKKLEGDWSAKMVGVTSPMGADNVLTVWTKGDITRLRSKALSSNVLWYWNASDTWNVNIWAVILKHTSIFTPSLPKDKVAAIDNLAIGVVDKIVLFFPKAWWPKTATFFGFVWNGAERMAIPKEDYWITKIFGASTPMGSLTALTLWTSGAGAELVETLPEDIVKRKVMELIRRFMGKDRTIPEPTAMLRSSWYSNPFTRGSYTYDNVQSPQHPDARATLAEPLVDTSGAPRVLFAGEATDNTHFSTVHGATDTGFREANRLLPQSKL